MKKNGSSARLTARKVALIIATVFLALSLISVFSINLSDRTSNEAALYKANYSIDKNGVYTISPKKGYDGFSSLTINANVVGEIGPTVYNVSSVDELPTNAVDGSMAIVESDSDILGVWQLPLDDIDEAFTINTQFVFESNGRFFWAITFIDDILSYSGANDSLGENPYDGVWDKSDYSVIDIKSSSSRKIHEWLQNIGATRIEARKAYSLYTCSNGVWSYNCETFKY